MAQFNTKNQSSTVARRWFTDIDINMNLHPESKDVVLKYDLNAIKRSVRNIIQTNHYERPFKPGFGASIRGLLFELTTERKIRKAQQRIRELITTFEPRVKNVEVRLNDADNNEVHLTVYYSIINSVIRQTMEMTITRAR